MPTPRTSTFLRRLRASQLLADAQLDEIEHWAGKNGADGKRVARELVARGLLTDYQANRILAGHTAFFLGPYTLLDQLGRGGMGQVFKAVHRRMQRTVAIKALHRSKLKDPAAKARFLREVRASAQLNHPNIVTAFDVGEEGDTTYLVMEYVEGPSLSQCIREQGRMPAKQAARIAYEVALALQHACDSGIVHRDIKPANILVDEHGAVKVLDMGLARMDDSVTGVDDSTTLTQDGVVMGTLDYLAPEQALDSHNVDIRADIYSLGCTLYHILTGQAPFPGGTAAEKLMKHQMRRPEPLTELAPEAPASLEAIVARMMAKDVAARFQTPTEVADALDAFLSGRPVELPPGPMVERAAPPATGGGGLAVPLEEPLASAAPPDQAAPDSRSDWGLPTLPPEEDSPAESDPQAPPPVSGWGLPELPPEEETPAVAPEADVSKPASAKRWHTPTADDDLAVLPADGRRPSLSEDDDASAPPHDEPAPVTPVGPRKPAPDADEAVDLLGVDESQAPELATRSAGWWVIGGVAVTLGFVLSALVGPRKDKSQSTPPPESPPGEATQSFLPSAQSTPAPDSPIGRLTHGDFEVRRAAARELGERGDTRAVDPLIAAMEDHDSDVRAAVAQALGELEDGRAVRPLLAALHDADDGVRESAARSLVQIGKPAVRRLIGALQDHDSNVRATVARALGDINDTRATKPLIDRLKDSDKAVRKSAADALGHLADERAAGPLLAALDDEDSDVQTAAGEALLRTGPAAVDTLIKAAHAEDSRTRVAVVALLGRLDDARTIAPLLVALGDRHDRVRERARAALTGKGSSAVGALVKALQDLDPTMRKRAAEELVRIGAASVRSVIETLDKAGALGGEEAAWVLGQVGDTGAVGPLIRALEERGGNVRASAAEALGKLRDVRAVRPLLAAMRDRTPRVRKAAAAALKALGPMAVRRLIAALRDEQGAIRTAAAEALGMMGRPAVGAVLAALDDGDSDVRVSAARTLGLLGDKRAVAPLIRALKDRDCDVRESAALALGKLGDKRATRPLIAALRDTHTQVRNAASEALRQMGR